MSDFNISSWKKNQYLDQAGLLSEVTLPMPSFFYKMWEIISKDLDKQAVASGDRMSYFSAEFPTASSFERYMRRQLEGTQLNEAPGSTLNLSQDDMDKLHKDGKLEIDGHKLLFKVTKDKVNEYGEYKDASSKLNQELKSAFSEFNPYISLGMYAGGRPDSDPLKGKGYGEISFIHKNTLPDQTWSKVLNWVKSKGWEITSESNFYDFEDGERDYYPKVKFQFNVADFPPTNS